MTKNAVIDYDRQEIVLTLHVGYSLYNSLF